VEKSYQRASWGDVRVSLLSACRVVGSWKLLHEARSRPHFRDEKPTRKLRVRVRFIGCPLQ